MTLDEYLKRKNIGAADFARKLGINHATLSRILRGHQWPRKNLARQISEETGWRVNWNQMLKLPEGEDE